MFLQLDIDAAEHEVAKAAACALQKTSIRREKEKVKKFFDEYDSGGLAAAEPHDISHALAQGRVNELLLSSQFEKITIDDIEGGRRRSRSHRLSKIPKPKRVDEFVDDLIGQAHRTRTAVTFIANPELLASVGGLGALLE